MKKLIVTGRTIEEAVSSGLSQLNVSEERVNIIVLEQPSKGLFGLIGSKNAKIELELKADAAGDAIVFLSDVFRAMRVEANIERSQNEDSILLNITGKDLGVLIGKRGQTLDSLQYLTNIAANRNSIAHVRIMLDAENFRQRRQKILEELSTRLSLRVMKSKQEIMLEPMSPLERKIIHSFLQDHPKVKTFSKGDEPNRRVIIALK